MDAFWHQAVIHENGVNDGYGAIFVVGLHFPVSALATRRFENESKPLGIS
jgi:hypothetical protein